jgi:hypothetical protein
MVVGLSICNLQEGGADNMKSICGLESIEHLKVVDKVIFSLANSCLLSELFNIFKELID